MSKSLNLKEKLNFNNVDLTAPDHVIQDVAAEIAKETDNIIEGKIETYDGPMFSYSRKSGVAALSAALSGALENVDIQDSLGKQGTSSKKFEFYLSTPAYPQYKYIICYIEYNPSHYPVNIVLDQNISDSLKDTLPSYEVSVDTPSELEELFYSIITSPVVINVMQELIRVHQAQSQNNKNLQTLDENIDEK